MTNYAYTKDIPAANHNPSVDQGPMLTNTNSIANLIGEDHYTFGVSNGGFHKQIRLPDLTAIGNLAPRIANSGTLWTQKADSTGVSTESNLFYVPDQTSDEYQLTRTITGSKTLFSTSITYGAPPDVTRVGGWTFLPGGMLLQYGTATVNTDDNIPFPVTFSSVPFSVVVSAFYNNNNRSFSWVKTISASGFTTAERDSSGSNVPVRINWYAIGK